MFGNQPVSQWVFASALLTRIQNEGSDPKTDGIVLRLFRDIAELFEDKTCETVVSLSILELCNDKFRDLLAEGKHFTSPDIWMHNDVQGRYLFSNRKVADVNSSQRQCRYASGLATFVL